MFYSEKPSVGHTPSLRTSLRVRKGGFPRKTEIFLPEDKELDLGRQGQQLFIFKVH